MDIPIYSLEKIEKNYKVYNISIQFSYKAVISHKKIEHFTGVTLVASIMENTILIN